MNCSPNCEEPVLFPLILGSRDTTVYHLLRLLDEMHQALNWGSEISLRRAVKRSKQRQSTPAHSGHNSAPTDGDPDEAGAG